MEKINNEKKVKMENKTKIDSKKSVGTFLKEHVIKKTKVLTIIGLALAIVMITLFVLSDVKMVDENTTFPKTSILSLLKERGIILLLILLAGWVPYFYIPAIAYVVYIFMLSGDLLFNMELNGPVRTLVTNIIPVGIDIFTTSIIAAIGIYMASCTTRKYRYSQRASFSFLDVKIQLYQMFKKQDKYEKAVAIKEKRIEDMQKNDVKIDYKSIFKVAPIVIVVNLIVALIQSGIN